MELERSIPRSINYQDVLPVAVPAVARRRKFYPVNGTTFNFLGTGEIRVPIHSVNSMLDPQHSYVEYFVFNNGARTFGMDLGGAHTMFEEIRLEQGGRVLVLNKGVVSWPANRITRDYTLEFYLPHKLTVMVSSPKALTRLSVV